MNAVILIIEDEADIAEFIKKVLTDSGYTAYTAQKGTTGLELFKKVKPDLVILDLNLPDIDGETVCTQIKEERPETQVLMLTARDSSREQAHGLNIGADDYMTKPFEPEILKARIAARLRTQDQGNKELQVGNLVLDPKTHSVKRGDHKLDLSPQEYKLLHYFMINPNQVLTREMILSRIWESSPDIQTRVVDVYVGYLRKKLDIEDMTPLIHSVRGFGYILKEKE